MNVLRKLIVLLLLALSSTTAFAITNAQVFAYAEANYPTLFTVPATAGQYQQYDYRYYPASGNYLAVDTSGEIFILGPYTGNVITSVGPVTAYTSIITAWEATLGLGAATIFTAAANPVNVTVTTDAARAASQVVTTAGATLNATAADGSQFTLVIPANAVTQDTTITMTPVTSMTGLPFANGLVAAVQFAPNGLFLEKDATLTIVPAVAVPVRNQTFIGYLDTGNDLHLVPPAAPTATIQMLVGHFSGIGLANGTSSERASMYLKIAKDYEARLTQEMARILSRERQLQLLGVDNVDEPSPFSLADLFKSYYELVVRPRMLAASLNCANAKLALRTYLGFERKYQVMGIPNPHDPGGVDLNKILKAYNCMAGNLQFVITGDRLYSGGRSYIRGSADIIWNPVSEESTIDMTTYLPSGTITAEIGVDECDPVHVTRPISLDRLSNDGGRLTLDGGRLNVIYSTSLSFPNTYSFWLRTDSWDQTYYCGTGTDRKPRTYNSSLELTVSSCDGSFIRYSGDAARLAGTLSCVPGDNLIHSPIGGSEQVDITWDFKKQ